MEKTKTSSDYIWGLIGYDVTIHVTNSTDTVTGRLLNLIYNTVTNRSFDYLPEFLLIKDGTERHLVSFYKISAISYAEDTEDTENG